MSKAQAVEQDDFGRRSKAFIDWFQSRPGASVNPNITIADYSGRYAGRGVQATADIPADSDLFTIPRSSTLSIETSTLAEKLPTNFFSSTTKDQDHEESNVSESQNNQAEQKVYRRSWTALILVLIYEYLRPGDTSTWKPYLDVLPRSFDTLMFWSNEELRLLTGCAVLDKIGKESAEKEFRDTVLPIVRRHKSVFFGSAEGEKEWSDEDLINLAHVMGSTIMAYAFDIEDEQEAHGDEREDEDGFVTDDEEDQPVLKAMVPLADTLNADAPPNASLFHGEDRFTMKALRDISAGEEILNDYGPLPRSDLLRRYGYITDNYAPFDCVEVGLDAVTNAVQGTRKNPLEKLDLEQRIEYLEDKDVLEDGSFDIVWPDQSLNGGFFPATMIRVVCTLLADNSEFKQAAKSMDNDALLRQDVRDTLIKLADTRLSDYGDELVKASSATSQDNRRHWMASIIRGGEVSLLREAIASLTVDKEQPRAKRQRLE